MVPPQRPAKPFSSTTSKVTNHGQVPFSAMSPPTTRLSPGDAEQDSPGVISSEPTSNPAGNSFLAEHASDKPAKSKEVKSFIFDFGEKVGFVVTLKVYSGIFAQ